MIVRMAEMAARHARVSREVEARVIEVLRSGRYVGGPVVAECEEAVARLLGRAHAVGVASGTDALTLALLAVGVGPGDEVIVPAVTFVATLEAVRIAGGRPVPVDVRSDRPLMDPDAVARAITSRTRAAIPVHLFGDFAELPDLGLPIVDDAAQALGGDPPRAQGTLTAVSFYPTKVLGAAGDGGMVAGDDPRSIERVRQIGNHGSEAGRTSRLDAVQAAVLLGHLPDLDARIARRRAIARRYDEVAGRRALPRDPGSPVTVYCLRVSRRDGVAEAFRERGIETAVYYPQPHGDPVSCPNARSFCAEALAVPCHESLTDDEVEAVSRAIEECVA